VSVADRLVTRQRWGAVPPRERHAIPGPMQGNTGHYEGPHMGTPDHSRCAGLVRGIQAFHMNDADRRWLDIAYSSMFCPHGFVFEGRWLGVRTAANGTDIGNTTTYAHAYLGGERDPLTPDAKAAFVDVVNFFRANGSGTKVFPHNHWLSTGCPGEELAAFIAQGIPAAGGGPSHRPAPGGVPGAVAFMGRPGGGGWIVAQDGGVFGIGTTPFFGSMGGQPLAQPIVGGAATPSGRGYWLVGSDGGVFGFGDATFRGSLAGRPLAAPISAMASTPDGEGYWLVGRDGGVFAFGNAPFHGSQTGRPLRAPIVAIAAAQGGYLLAGADGGVFAFGTRFFGSIGNNPLNAPVVGIAPTPAADGYWLFAADGGVFAFGHAPFRGTYAPLLEEYARDARRIMGGVVVGDGSTASTWGYELFSDRLPVERYHFAP
jgi:hypothetical protein